eukprot:5208309-Pyramimonas_sp.AAC.1
MLEWTISMLEGTIRMLAWTIRTRIAAEQFDSQFDFFAYFDSATLLTEARLRETRTKRGTAHRNKV